MRLALVAALSLCLMGCDKAVSPPIRPNNLCAHDGHTVFDVSNRLVIDAIGASAHRPVMGSLEMLQHIQDLRGVRREIEVVQRPGLNNACAERTSENQPRVHVDEEWLSESTAGNYWLKLFVLSHEVGHIENDHVLTEEKDLYKRELDADYFAGRALNLDGATDADIAVISMAFRSCRSTPTGRYPPCAIREAAALEGYRSTRLLAPVIQEAALPAFPIDVSPLSNGTDRQLPIDLELGEAGFELIRGREGFLPSLINDVSGSCTIGLGHLVSKNTCAEADLRKFPESIDESTAIKLLRLDLQPAQASVARLVTVPLSQNEYDALVSFVFSVGERNFASSTMLVKLNGGDYASAAREFSRWIKLAERASPGLVQRRQAEVDLFLTRVYPFCRHPSHGVESFRTIETVTGVPGQDEWSSCSGHGSNSESKHCDSRVAGLVGRYSGVEIVSRTGSMRSCGDGNLKYRCSVTLKRDPIYHLQRSAACVAPS